MKQILRVLGLVFLLAGFAAASEKISNEVASRSILVEFTFTKGQCGIFLPVKFEGKEYLFVFDTGSSHTMFDISFRQALGKAKRVSKGITSKGAASFEVFDAPKAFLGPLNMQDCGEVLCIDFSMLTMVAGKKISGIIGMDFLKKYVIQIDFDTGKMLFLKTAGDNNSHWHTSLPITYSPTGIPQIKANILDGIRIDFSEDFVIDTGANTAGSLSRRIFYEIVAKRKLKVAEEIYETASGTMRKKIIRVSDIQIGPLYYKNLIFSEGIWSFLGLEFLSRHLVAFDFPGNRFYLKKGEDFDKVDESDMSGLHLLSVSNEIIVYSVDRGSPAQKAGMRANDVIIRINGRDSDAYEIQEIRQLLKSGDGYKIAMTIKRGDEIKKVSFQLETRI